MIFGVNTLKERIDMIRVRQYMNFEKNVASPIFVRSVWNHQFSNKKMVLQHNAHTRTFAFLNI